MPIPPRYEHVQYDDVPLPIRESFNTIKKLRRGIFISGGVGTGKTHTIYALKKQWDDNSTSPAPFFNTTELLREIKDDFDRPYGEKRNTLESLIKNKSPLFLDDMGSEKVSEWVQETFYLLINHKYNECTPVIISSNYTLAELKERIGERVVSRLLEMCDRFSMDLIDRRFDKVINQSSNSQNDNNIT